MNKEKKLPEETEENNFSHRVRPSASPENEPKKESWLDIVKFALITAAIVLPIRFFIAQPFIVSGPSMLPTFENNDYLIVDEISYRLKKPVRGEVIVFRRSGESKYLIKRIVGLPKETVELLGETVTIKNAEHPEGFALDQSFIINKKSESKTTVILDSGEYFVMGDNRPVSYDSRYWGSLPASQIVGRPLIRLYPFNKMALWPGGESQ